MPIPGNLIKTPKAIMPHRDAERALEMALSMDVPFWPQLQNYSYYEKNGYITIKAAAVPVF